MPLAPPQKNPLDKLSGCTMRALPITLCSTLRSLFARWRCRSASAPDFLAQHLAHDSLVVVPPHLNPAGKRGRCCRPSNAAGRFRAANTATGSRSAEDRRSRSSPSAYRSCAAVRRASPAESTAPGAPIRRRSGRWEGDPRPADTSAYQPPSRCRITSSSLR